MSKKIVAPVAQKSDLIESLGEFSRFKNIDRATLMSVLEDVFRTMIKKRYGTDENFNVIVNVDKGDLQAFRERIIVEDAAVTDETREIPLSEALQMDEDYEVGDGVAEVISFVEFGRRHVLSAKQLLAQRIKELEKTLVYNQYKDLTGEIIVGEVHQKWKNEMVITHEDNELILPRSEQIPRDVRYKKGETIRAVVHEVTMRNGTPRIVVSRTSPVFLEKLMEQNVPEIADGTIIIKKTVRDPGERAKVAVESFDDRIDPVGACVGMRGSRINGVVRELHHENIDIVNYTTNPVLYIQRALGLPKSSRLEINEEEKTASVWLKPDQIAPAIGKNGTNVKLVRLLTGYEIDIYRESDPDELEDDVELDEFSDEIDSWIIDAFKAIGCDTAKSVLRLSVVELERRTDLEHEVILHVLEILRQEFED